MATQKNIKSKATASKSKTSKVAPAKKTTSKSPSKAKPVTGKGKPAVKAKPKAKKAALVTKAKKAAPVTKAKTNKPAAKPSGKKLSPKASTPARKAATATKAKPIQKKVKATPKPKTPVTAKPVKTTPKVVVKAAPTLPSKPVHKPVQAAKAVPQTPVKAEAKAKTVQAKVHTTTLPKSAAKSTGSKISDVATKPSVSSKVMHEKPEIRKESTFKPSKPFTVHSGKPIEKMSERKENKPVAAATLPEEPQKTRYNDKELEEFDQLIDQKLIVAREQLEFYLKQLEDMAENPDNKIKGLDDGLSSLESERISSMASRQQKLIQHLENAKIRIKNKVYGICRETGKLISKERLRAVPHATLSIEAKQAQN